MTPETFTRLDALVQRALGHESCVAVMPGELRELLRLARIGHAVETPKARALHVDDGN